MSDGPKFTIQLIHKSWKEIKAAAELGSRTCLVYEYLDDLASRLTIDQAVECYRHVFSQTTMKPEVSEGMLPLWLHGWVNRDQRLEKAALMPAGGDVSWGWSAVHTFRDRFINLGSWPKVWEMYLDLDNLRDRRRGLKSEMVELLRRTIAETIHNRANAAQDNPDPTSFSWRHGYEFHCDGDVERTVAEEHRSTLVLGDWRTYPPYFPGDTTRIRPVFRKRD